jgi:hypothetical protein
MSINRTLGSLVSIAVLSTSLAGCGGGSTGTGAAIGGIGGALLTGSFGGAALGAAAGAGIGYLSEQEKNNARDQVRKDQQAAAQSRVTSNPETAYRPKASSPFVGSTWRVISYESDELVGEYSEIMVTFPSNSKVTTMFVRPNGETEVFAENYAVVDDVIVFQGKEDGKEYRVPARFTINDKLLSLKFEDSSFVLEEVEESA